uniref:Uncharacterized protein n=1 Tax=Anguilla anguilla TaxID=7936 RepID=A0A0E9Q2M5_ANGAN
MASMCDDAMCLYHTQLPAHVFNCFLDKLQSCPY